MSKFLHFDFVSKYFDLELFIKIVLKFNTVHFYEILGTNIFNSYKTSYKKNIFLG